MNPLQPYLPSGVTPETLLATIIGCLTFCSVLLAWRSLIEDRPRSSRMRAIARRRLEAEASAKAERKARRRSSGRGGSMLSPKGLRLLRAAQTERVAEKLLRAGIRSREAIVAYSLSKLACPILLAFLAVAVLAVDSFGLSGPSRAAMICFVTIVGFFAPDIYLANLSAKRRLALQKALPDGLDLMVICAEAGLTLDAALHRVADEIAGASPELADELAITSVELNFLPERRLALLNLAKRVDLPALRGVVNTLIQTERYGTPLAQSLRVLSAEFREQRMLRAEEKAARLPAILTVPMIIFILPTLFIVLIGPAIIDVMNKMAN